MEIGAPGNLALPGIGLENGLAQIRCVVCIIRSEFYQELVKMVFKI